MSGIVLISQQMDWDRPGWLYDSVLRGIAAQLQSSDPDLAATVARAMTQAGSGILDLRHADGSTLSKLAHAAQGYLDARLAPGARPFARPEYFPEFIDALRRLVADLEGDPRARTSDRNNIPP